MAFRLKFSGRAVREVGEAHEWYEGQSEGLGLEFVAALELQLRRLEQAPLLRVREERPSKGLCRSAQFLSEGGGSWLYAIPIQPGEPLLQPMRNTGG